MRAAGQIDPTEDLGGVTLIGHRIPWLIQMDFHMLVRLAPYILNPPVVSLFVIFSVFYNDHLADWRSDNKSEWAIL